MEICPWYQISFIHLKRASFRLSPTLARPTMDARRTRKENTMDTVKKCCLTVMDALTEMLGGLAQRGV
jgi:hypothetical protein